MSSSHGQQFILNFYNSLPPPPFRYSGPFVFASSAPADLAQCLKPNHIWSEGSHTWMDPQGPLVVSKRIFPHIYPLKSASTGTCLGIDPPPPQILRCHCTTRMTWAQFMCQSLCTATLLYVLLAYGRRGKGTFLSAAKAGSNGQRNKMQESPHVAQVLELFIWGD